MLVMMEYLICFGTTLDMAEILMTFWSVVNERSVGSYARLHLATRRDFWDC